MRLPLKTPPSHLRQRLGGTLWCTTMCLRDYQGLASGPVKLYGHTHGRADSHKAFMHVLHFIY